MVLWLDNHAGGLSGLDKLDRPWTTRGVHIPFTRSWRVGVRLAAWSTSHLSSRQASSWSARARCCSCTGRSTTTGRSPRARSTPVSTSRRPPCARSPRRPGSTSGSGLPLTTQRYTVRNGQGRTKRVSYWTGRVIGGDDVSTYQPNAEIDAVEWVPLDKAARLADLRPGPGDAGRAGRAPPRAASRWSCCGTARPAPARTGRRTTGSGRSTRWDCCRPTTVVPILGAYGVKRILSSSSRRCWTTLSPYADVADLDLEVTRDLSEEDATPAPSRGTCTGCSAGPSRPCCAPTGRCSRTCTTPSGCPTRS